MSSFGGTPPNPKRWRPYATAYTDCSQGICSVYCPQWCYILFPPPPSRHDQSSSTEFSPVIIAFIGVLATVFILICYFLLISKYCKRRGDGRITTELNEHRDLEAWQQAATSNNVGLDEAVIRQIAVCKYKRGDGLIQGTECSVCLGEFQEEESLRLLPKCCHAFHVNCIDAWFKSHSSCPICRANIIIVTQDNGVSSSRVVNVAALEYRPAVARVFVMESRVRQETVLVVGEDTDSRC